MKSTVILLLLMVILSVAGTGCTSPQAQRQEPANVGAMTTTGTGVPGDRQIPASSSFAFNVDTLSPGAQLPDIYTCKGAGGSPEISWQNVPTGTKSLVLILDDPDAPAGTFTHWIVYNIPPSSAGLAQNQPAMKVLPDGSQQGTNTAGTRGYYPPCPPVGTTHRYLFHLYAVDMDIVQPTADRDSIEAALNGHTIGQVGVSTLFGR